jgi:hypothetical protein
MAGLLTTDYPPSRVNHGPTGAFAEEIVGRCIGSGGGGEFHIDMHHRCRAAIACRWSSALHHLRYYDGE